MAMVVCCVGGVQDALHLRGGVITRLQLDAELPTHEPLLFEDCADTKENICGCEIGGMQRDFVQSPSQQRNSRMKSRVGQQWRPARLLPHICKSTI